MSEDLDQTAAAYALGLLRGAARAAIEARLLSDPALQAKVKLWQETFVAVDLAAGRQVPPAGLFDKILAAIGAGLPDTQTRRAGTGVWTEMSPGLTYTVLFEDSEDLDQTAAAYALGLLRGAARAAIEARLSSDPALQAKIKLWQENLVPVDLAAGRQVPAAGLFDTILDAIGAAETELPGTQTRRAGTGVWTEMSPGVTYTVLFEDSVAKRRSLLVRALPGSNYGAHAHPEGHEECLVLEGDLIMGDLKLLAGDFHLAEKGSTHPAATTRSGCVLFQSIAF